MMYKSRMPHLGVPQHPLPDGPDSGYVSVLGDVAVGLQGMTEREVGAHSLQHVRHVAEAQLGLQCRSPRHQLHAAGNQRDLACAEHCLVHLHKQTQTQTHTCVNTCADAPECAPITHDKTHKHLLQPQSGILLEQ